MDNSDSSFQMLTLTCRGFQNADKTWRCAVDHVSEFVVSAAAEPEVFRSWYPVCPACRKVYDEENRRAAAKNRILKGIRKTLIAHLKEKETPSSSKEKRSEIDKAIADLGAMAQKNMGWTEKTWADYADAIRKSLSVL